MAALNIPLFFEGLFCYRLRENMTKKRRRKPLTKEQANYILDMRIARMFRRWWFMD